MANSVGLTEPRSNLRALIVIYYKLTEINRDQSSPPNEFLSVSSGVPEYHRRTVLLDQEFGWLYVCMYTRDRYTTY